MHLQDEGIVVFAVGIGSNTNKEELAAIASTPKSPEDKYLFEVENFNELDDTVKHKLTTKACEGRCNFCILLQTIKCKGSKLLKKP